MADKKKGNIFKRIRNRFSDIRQELKRVIWPTREKLTQTSIVVLTVIVIAAVVLTLISKGGTAILERVGFYQEVPTSTTEVTTATPEVTVAETTAIAVETTIAAVDETTEAVDSPETDSSTEG